MNKREEVFTCAYQEVCDCGQGLMCEHPKNYEQTCDLNDKNFKCPLGLTRNWKKSK